MKVLENFRIMNSDHLHLFAHNLSYDGIIISSENKSALETSLKVLKDEMSLDKLYYWGRISTLGSPYHIAQGIEEITDPFSKRTLFSQDCINWALLNPPTDQMKKNVKRTKGMLTGQLSFDSKDQEGEESEDDKGFSNIISSNRNICNAFLTLFFMLNSK